MDTVVLRGKVISGRGEGAAFTQLRWVREQFIEKLGIDPFPGTLNLRLEEPAEFEKWRRLKQRPGIAIEPASADFCEARGYPAVAVKPTRQAAGDASQNRCQPAAILLPDVPEYPRAQVELIAPVSLRETLELADGDVVGVHVEGEQTRG